MVLLDLCPKCRREEEKLYASSFSWEEDAYPEW
jgi:hypothetical protein